MTKVTVAHLEARRTSILEAAKKTFARRGISTATMAEIAEEAGISAGAIYRYFESKEALAMACFQENAEAMAADWHRQVESSLDPMAVFNEISRHSFAELDDASCNDATRVMLEGTLTASRSGDAAMLEAQRIERETIVRGLQEPLQRAQAAGQIPAELDTYTLAQALLSFYFGARFAKLYDLDMDTTAQLRQVQLLFELARGESTQSQPEPELATSH
jgi:AcrR family transcriptional regulator